VRRTSQKSSIVCIFVVRRIRPWVECKL